MKVKANRPSTTVSAPAAARICPCHVAVATSTTLMRLSEINPARRLKRLVESFDSGRAIHASDRDCGGVGGRAGAGPVAVLGFWDTGDWLLSLATGGSAHGVCGRRALVRQTAAAAV